MTDWEVLAIESTSERRSVKRAYAKAIKGVDPSIDPEKFQKIREAYERLIEEIEYSSVNHEDLDDNAQTFIDNAIDIQNLTSNRSDSENSDDNSKPFESDNIDLTFDTDNVDSIIDRFLTRLEEYLVANDEHGINEKAVLELLQSEELHFIEVNQVLRIRVYNLFVNYISTFSNSDDSYDELLVKAPKGLASIIKDFSLYFDWKGSELEISRYFSLEEIKIVSVFYDYYRHQLPIKESNKSGSKDSFALWIILFILVTKGFQFYKDKYPEKDTVFNKYEYLVDKKPCNYIYENLDEVQAIKCESSLKPNDAKSRNVLATFWRKKYERGVRNKIDIKRNMNSLAKATTLLEEASKLNYIPSMYTLSMINIGSFYNINNVEAGINILNKIALSGDTKANLLLASDLYLGVWSVQNSDKSMVYFSDINENNFNLQAEQAYVLAVAKILGLVKKDKGGQTEDIEEILSSLVKFNEEIAPKYLNELAWFLATTDSIYFHPKIALNLSKEFSEENGNSKDWMYIDTLAAAYAANGQFEDAVIQTNRAIDFLKEKKIAGSDDSIESSIVLLKKRINLYNNNQIIQNTSDKEVLGSIFNMYLSELWVLPPDIE